MFFKWKKENRQVATDSREMTPAAGTTISQRNIEAAAEYLLRCAALHPRDGMRFEIFVEGDVWYDQPPLATSFGLDPKYEDDLNVVYSFLGLIFFLAADCAKRAGLGWLNPREGSTYFTLTRAGKLRYPSPPDEDYEDEGEDLCST